MKEASLRKVILADPTYTTFLKRQNCGDNEKVNGCQRLGGKGLNKRGIEDFEGTRNTLLCHSYGYMSSCIFVQTMECTPRVKHNVQCVLWVTMVCQCRFINCNKYVFLVQGVDNGGGCACVGAGGILEVSVPTTQILL